MIIGVTGNFGSGKSTVAGMFHKRGAKVIDADQVVRELLTRDDRCRCAIRGVFGDQVITSGELDRAKLASAAFGDPRLLKKLEAILHPLVKERFLEEIERSANKFIVLDVPLLIEARWTDMVDVVIVVRASVGDEIKRLNKRSGHTRAEVLRRLKYQLPFGKKRKFADFVVDNRGRLSDTDKQVKKIMDTLNREIHKGGS